MHMVSREASLGDEAEESTVCVKAPRPPQLDDLDPLFVVTIEEFVCDFSVRGLVGEFERLRAEPLHADDDAYRLHVRSDTPRSRLGESHRSGIGSFCVPCYVRPVPMTQNRTRAKRPDTYDPSVLSEEEKERFLAALEPGPLRNL